MKRRWTTLRSLKDLHEALYADEQARKKHDFIIKKAERIARKCPTEVTPLEFAWICRGLGLTKDEE